ncbi:PhzF family phenazine biosynthesis protein [Pseudomonas putida]|uniref:PhzF family phenazine biosynthesis protein n=1 Tax=Pseudomonas putida TaxID=303 RepID=A0A7W2KXH9_PSEPU|nr:MULTISPECIES: PhzF family phenazine biosynthesis protein [Pseudomonas]MBA6114616.1 PhzF family phenazine biosynthesis protein [Pseudomonas putida]MBI6941257.1 PhzF family phenazine biosynthesis protein [Pseudomonas putida]MBI6957628.1 PhzF family phenazine biosynthesis protein [Pseudomonas putida]MCZ9638849.1 PhzF family phenazine biosynthesis protein [Pseudomonas putida]MEC4875710.1 PhzF family phenazine biosynthesis protein [Pseudomonas sp. NC26]
MQLEIFQVDAFCAEPFGGNPAAVIPLESWLPDDVLQRIAEENNLSETAFFVRNGEGFDLRWFTPAVEVDLCGHATLAAAYVLFEHLGEQAQVLRFATRSGELRVSRSGDGLLAMDFPAKQPVAVDTPAGLLKALGLGGATAVYRSDDYVVVIDDAALLDPLEPDFVALSAFAVRGIAVTAPGRGFDFVTRWFGPRVGVNEDPVTGSAHTSLAPLWAQRLGKSVLSCEQGGARKGQLYCEVPGNGRVIISGRAVLYLRGSVFI